MEYEKALYEDESQFNKAKSFYEFADSNDIILKESFYGFFYLF